MGRRTPVNVEVTVYDQDQVGRLIKKFSRKVKKCGILDEVRARRHFVKKSVKKRKKRLEKKRLSQLSTKKHKEKLNTN